MPQGINQFLKNIGYPPTDRRNITYPYDENIHTQVLSFLKGEGYKVTVKDGNQTINYE